MKTRNIFLLALSSIFAASCHTWDDPSVEAGVESYGNQYIQETNVVTINDLKTQYKSVISDNSLKQITKPTQIKVIVTGNDEGSNLYKQVYVSDGTGSLYVSIDKSGIFSEAAVGQCLLIELEGLYIGAYGQQPEIGTFYHNDSKDIDQVGRMSRFTWRDHFKLIPAVEGLSAKPEEVVSMAALDMEKDCGKLVTLVGVKMKAADGKATFAPSDGSAQLIGGCVNREISNMGNVVVRTSTYAKFAAMVMPTEPIDITGIAARYGNTWQIMPRTQDDIKKSTHEPITPTTPAGTGTKNDPYNVAGVLAYVESLGADKESPNDIYFSGVITAVSEEFGTQYGTGTFIISDSELGLNSFTFYRGYFLNNKKFTASDTQVKKGDKVVICGKVINYKGTTPETSQNKAYIVTLNGEGNDNTGGGDDNTGGGDNTGNSNVTVSTDGTTMTLINTAATASANTVSVKLSEQGWENAADATTITLTDGTTIAFDKNGGNNAPKYYTSGSAVRMYAKNSLVITGASKAIAKVVLTAAGASYLGNPTLYATATGNALSIINDQESNSGGTQLRVQSIDITYAE